MILPPDIIEFNLAICQESSISKCINEVAKNLRKINIKFRDKLVQKNQLQA